MNSSIPSFFFRLFPRLTAPYAMKEWQRVNTQRVQNGLSELSFQEYQQQNKKGRVPVKRTVHSSRTERYTAPMARTGSASSPRSRQAIERQLKVRLHFHQHWKTYAAAIALGAIMYAGFTSDFSHVLVSYEIKPF